MKLAHSLLLLSILAALSITSCVVDPGYAGGGYSSRGPSYGPSYRSGYNTYSTLPPNYSGSAYYSGGRYYSGGNYQTGRYSYQGRTYTNRYQHNGQYYYGGTHAHYPGDGHDHSQQRIEVSPYGSTRTSYRSF